MATVSVFLKKSKSNSKGQHPLVLRIADSGNRRLYFSTGFYTSDEYFDSSSDGGRFFQGKGVKSFLIERREETGEVKSYTNKEANDLLASFENRARNILKKYTEERINWSFEQFKNDFSFNPKRVMFLSYAEHVIEEEFQKNGRYKKARIATEALRSMNRYDENLGKKVFQDISAGYLNGYIKFYKDAGLANNTIGIRLREIRRIFNIAIREKVITPDLYPFSKGSEDGKVKLPKPEMNRTDQYLTMESLKLLANAHFDNYVLERTKHLFLFSFYCRGMNWKDMALLTRESFYTTTVMNEKDMQPREVEMLQYNRSKTKGAFHIMITPSIQRELDWFKENTILYGDFVLPIISLEVAPEKLDDYLAQVRKRFNKSLKEIAKILNFPESQQDINIYTARHSFAMAMQSRSKSIEVISQALGHQSVETTKHYLAKFSTTRMAEETEFDLSA